MSVLDDPIVIFTGTAWQAEQLRGLLEQAGIESFLRDEVMGRIDAPALAAGAMGAVKVVVTREHAERAAELLRDFGAETRPGVAVEVPPEPPWVCVHCGEQVEAQFDGCWNCGAARGD
jgi:hypothetical protein